MKSPAILVASFLITTNTYASEVMSAQFRTMAACLSGIKTSSGQQLKFVTDKPH